MKLKNKKAQTGNPLENWLPWVLWIALFVLLLVAVLLLRKKLGIG